MNQSAMQTFAVSQVGKPYLVRTSGPDYYDCSGFVNKCYSSIGLNMPDLTAEGIYELYNNAQMTKEFDANAIYQPGDLFFIEDDSHIWNRRFIKHIMLVLDSNTLIHATEREGINCVYQELIKTYVSHPKPGRKIYVAPNALHNLPLFNVESFELNDPKKQLLNKYWIMLKVFIEKKQLPSAEIISDCEHELRAVGVNYHAHGSTPEGLLHTMHFKLLQLQKDGHISNYQWLKEQVENYFIFGVAISTQSI